ncbi:MAG: site-specific DNA-methyltransferase [Gammaproteobacteria bacterium]|nr:site-specific DNA-methyltransferase [Gammaproteobacteria bacterium]
MIMMRLHNGDCLNVLKMMIEDEVFVDSIVTDPPYELGFMGRSWDSTGIAFQKKTWELCFKVLKPGGHLLAFSGSRTYHRMAVAIEDAGFEIRDQVMWLYGSGFPKSMNVGKALDKKLGNERESFGTKLKKAGDMRGGNYVKGGDYKSIEIEITKGNTEWEGWGTALKPAHEPLVLARKPLSENSVVDNVLKHRTGGINIDECRVEGNDAKYPDTNPDFRDQGRQSKENMGIDKLSFGQTENVKRKKVVRKSRDENGVWTNDNSGMKAEGSEYADADPRGRFPSNVMHDGSGSIKELFEDKSKYFYCAKTSKAERNQGLDNFIKKNKVFNGQSPNASKDMKGVEQKFTTKPSANIHPTVKPIKLMKYLCRLITPKGGTILDPFMGSGSTGMAAKEENFEFVGIEKEEEYFNIATARIESVETKSTLEGFYD